MNENNTTNQETNLDILDINEEIEIGHVYIEDNEVKFMDINNKNLGTKEEK